MAEEEGAGSAQLLRNQKITLMGILSNDPDFVLQHADSLGLLTLPQYQRIKAVTCPDAQVRDLIDHVIQRGDPSSVTFLQLLEGDDMQDNFPSLKYLRLLKNIQKPAGGKEAGRKRKEASVSVEMVPAKQTCKDGPSLVTEKQLMQVARTMGRSWREVGRLALDIASTRLEQIEEEHPGNHVERVFAMLRCWRTRQRREATASRLHALLCQEDAEWALPPDSVDFLLEPS